MHFLEMCQENAVHIPGMTVHCAKHVVWVPALGTESLGAQARAPSMIKLSGRDFSIQSESSATFFNILPLARIFLAANLFIWIFV